MSDQICAINVATNLSEIVDISDIRSIDYQKAFSNVVTSKSKYRWPVTEEGLDEIIIKCSRHNFPEVARKFYVNINLVKRIHSGQELVFFDEINSLKEANQLKCYSVKVQSRNFRAFKHEFYPLFDIGYTTRDGINFKKIISEF